MEPTFDKSPASQESPQTTRPDVEDNGRESVEAIDFTKDNPAASRAIEITTTPYDPRPHEDGARRNIAYALIGLLCFIVFAMMAALWLGVIAAKDMKEFAVILGPVVTLVSAATGFYYGTKSNGG